ncbi:hypothetical protein B0H11DRAFT_2222538 [Mycena galericulata]|nr:hypothetical protein B0H11DRAFT_2222538 [Mycena galericulata]
MGPNILGNDCFAFGRRVLEQNMREIAPRVLSARRPRASSNEEPPFLTPRPKASRRPNPDFAPISAAGYLADALQVTVPSRARALGGAAWRTGAGRAALNIDTVDRRPRKSMRTHCSSSPSPCPATGDVDDGCCITDIGYGFRTTVSTNLAPLHSPSRAPHLVALRFATLPKNLGPPPRSSRSCKLSAPVWAHIGWATFALPSGSSPSSARDLFDDYLAFDLGGDDFRKHAMPPCDLTVGVLIDDFVAIRVQTRVRADSFPRGPEAAVFLSASVPVPRAEQGMRGRCLEGVIVEQRRRTRSGTFPASLCRGSSTVSVWLLRVVGCRRSGAALFHFQGAKWTTHLEGFLLNDFTSFALRSTRDDV